MLACMLATALQAQNTICDTVRNFPWSDGFDLGIACWTVPAGSNWMFFDPSAGGALLNSYIQSNSQPVGTDNWIVSRPIALPAVDSMNLVLEWGDGNYDNEDYPYRYSVLVTTSADPLAATAVWDTLYHVDGDTLVYNSSQSLFTRRQADLTAYAGQTVRLAFRHQPVVSVPNSYGLLRLCIDNVTVREMHPCVARAVPWSEDFASDSTRECWPDLIYYDYMGIPSARVWHHLLVSPAFDMPASAPDVQLRWTKQYSSVSGSRTLVLVSPTGGQDEADFTDTLYNAVNANLGTASDSVLLGQAYAGQRIRVALGVSSGYLVLSDVAVNNTTASPSDTLWRTVTVTANVAGACETYGSGVYADSSTVEIGYHVLDTTTEGGHWQFLGWSDGPTETPRQILVTSDTAIVTLFEWVADSVGIAEIEKLELKIEIFPNPTSGKVTVTSPEPLVAATLTDLMGRCEEVRLIPKGSIQYSIDFTSRPQGVYLLKLTTADGRQHTLKLLKQSDIFAK